METNAYLCFMTPFKKQIQVELLDEASYYFYQLPPKVQEKFLRSFDKTAIGLKGPWFEKLDTTEGIFEFRQRDHEKFYRIFAFWDTEAPMKTLILCTHGLNKKTKKTPRIEIEKAQNIKATYFFQKSKQ